MNGTRRKVYLEVELKDDHDLSAVELQEEVESLDNVEITRDITPMIEHVLRRARDLGYKDGQPSISN